MKDEKLFALRVPGISVGISVDIGVESVVGA